MKFIIWIIAAIVIAAVTVFAVSNRETVDLDFWPLPFSAEPPLFVVLFVALLVGFFFGGLARWWAGRKLRQKARSQSLEIDTLRRDLEMAKREAESPKDRDAKPAAETTPVSGGTRLIQGSAQN